MGNASSARVLVIEDDEPIRFALEVALRGEGYIIRAEPDGTAIAKVAAEFAPDLAVIDVNLPGGTDGYTVARRLRCTGDFPLVFVTAADSEEARLAGFGAGADDYVVKPFSMPELLARTRALLRRTGRLPRATWEVGDLVVHDRSGAALRAGNDLGLSSIEHRLLAFLVQHPGQVLSKSQLLSRVWGPDAYEPNLVEVQVSALRRKLEAHGPRILHTVRGMGYVLRP